MQAPPTATQKYTHTLRVREGPRSGSPPGGVEPGSRAETHTGRNTTSPSADSLQKLGASSVGLAPSGSSRLSSSWSLCPRASVTGDSWIRGADLGSVGALVTRVPGFAFRGAESVTSGTAMGSCGMW
ncbi:hypothetical protein CRUP_002720 [Coryphaenoides rupestris]|nr:hypothetical protein CRUP_002720 [Coryphaenoides rupestris]